VTVASLKVRVIRTPVLKAKVLPRFPSNVEGSGFITVVKANGTYTFGADYTGLDETPFTDPANTIIAVWDATSESWKQTTLSSLVSGSSQIEQHITAAGPVAINNNTGIVRVDQTVGAAITLTMPAAASKTCPVLIADWKNDAGTNNITITPNGIEKIQGLSSWTIGGDGGSIFLRPISGVGYVI